MTGNALACLTGGDSFNGNINRILDHASLPVTPPRHTAMAWLKAGNIQASLAIIALQWLALEKPLA
jgi:hypothetical protein